MYNIIKASQNDRRALFLNTAQKMGLHEAIVEKDFWVCLTLDYLFHRCKWKDAFLFKGGTSLSKAYGLIRRFSEDIDLVMGWRLLGYEKDEPWRPRSKTQQDLFNHEAIDRSAAFLHDQFLPVLQQDLSAILGEDAHVEINDDPNVIDFYYPHIFDAGRADALGKGHDSPSGGQPSREPPHAEALRPALLRPVLHRKFAPCGDGVSRHSPALPRD